MANAVQVVVRGSLIIAQWWPRAPEERRDLDIQLGALSWARLGRKVAVLEVVTEGFDLFR